MAQLSDDCFAFGGDLTPVDEALAQLVRVLVPVTEPESVALPLARGRILAEAVSASENVPPYDAMAAGRYEDVPESWPMITHEMVRPRGAYGASKVWGEAVGRHFSDMYGLSVLCVRIGSVLDHNDPSRIGPSMAWLSHRDVVDILVRCVEAPEELRYDIFLATSRNRYGYRDLEHARDVLGYVPQDTDDSAFQS